MRLGRTLSLITAAALAVSCSSPTGPGTADLTDPALVESESLQLVNVARTDHSAEELDRLQKLAEVARRHSQDMQQQGELGHVGINGGTLAERLAQAGIEFKSAGENLAFIGRVATPAAEVHGLLMNNPQHRVNILQPDFQLAGVGVVAGPEGYWLTQVFIKP